MLFPKLPVLQTVQREKHMTPEQKNFLQTVGRFIDRRMTEKMLTLQGQFDQQKAEMRELRSLLVETQAKLDADIWCGVWNEQTAYEQGNKCSHAGSVWLCLRSGTMARPGTATKDWVLICKRGRDGRDARGVPEREHEDAAA
jgi:hypothetical protein